MKKIIALLLVLTLILGLCLLTGCNQQVFDTTYSFEEAYVFGPNGQELAHGTVSSWKDYDDGTVQVVIDGRTYYTDLQNVILISH